MLQGSKILQQKILPPKDDERTQPIESFILLEHYNAIQLAQQVHASLASLAKVIKGDKTLSISQNLIFQKMTCFPDNNWKLFSYVQFSLFSGFHSNLISHFVNKVTAYCNCNIIRTLLHSNKFSGTISYNKYS